MEPAREDALEEDSAPEPEDDDLQVLETEVETEHVVAEELEVTTEEPDGKRRKKGLGAWVSSRAKKVVHSFYDSRADDIEERARRAVGSAYRDSADDLQNRAVEAMRAAIRSEAQTIKDAIEHSVQVKKREARLSLLVLVVASLVYLLLYWITHRGAPAS